MRKPPADASALALALAAWAASALAGAAPAAAQPACGPWADPHTTVVEAAPGDDLAAKVRAAGPGTTVLLAPGRYRVPATLRFEKDDVTLRSRTGRREDVVLDGDAPGTGRPAGFTPEVIVVSASGVTLADFSVRHARDHAVHAYPPAGRPIAGLRLRNLHVSDCGQQLVKVNSNGKSPLHWADSGTVECSFIGFLDNSVMEPSGEGFYTGGIDIHGGRGWTIRGNLFRGIERQGKAMEHAVHLWSRSRDCVVEGNRFEDVYRAVGLGMKTSAEGLVRAYPDGKGEAPYSDFIGGRVANNVIWNRAGVRLESGIEIMNAVDAVVVHNTVWSAETPFSSIEYRWPNTSVTLRNNLVSKTLLRRDQAQAQLGGNVENAPASAFVDAAKGDLRLAAGSPAIDQGVRLPPGWADRDLDGDLRDILPDAGADERGTGARIRRSGGPPRKSTPAVRGTPVFRGFRGDGRAHIPAYQPHRP